MPKSKSFTKLTIFLFGSVILVLLISEHVSKTLKSGHSSKHHHNYENHIKSNHNDNRDYEMNSDSLNSNVKINEDDLSLSKNQENELILNPLSDKSSFVSLNTKTLQQKEDENLSEDSKSCCKKIPQISLSGTARTTLRTDVINIGLKIDSKRPTAQEALLINTQTSNTVTKALKENGVSDNEISTVNYSLEPQFISVKDTSNENQYTQKPDGFKVSNFINVKTTKVNLAGKLIDIAVENGANKIEYVRFNILPETMEKVKKMLIDSAVEDAKAKSKEVLNPLNYEASEISSITVGEFSPIAITYDEEASAGASRKRVESALPMIFNNEREVSASVYVVFLIRKKSGGDS